MEKEKRSKWVHIMATETERQSWSELAERNNLTLSDLIRKQLGAIPNNFPPKPKPKHRMTRRADPQLLAWLGRLNSNLNQIAKWANTYKRSAEAAEVISCLIAIEGVIKSEINKETEKDGDD